MSIILKNNASLPYLVTDLGISVPAYGTYDLTAQPISAIRKSSILLMSFADSTLIMNDGLQDLTALAAVNAIYGAGQYINVNPIVIDDNIVTTSNVWSSYKVNYMLSPDVLGPTIKHSQLTQDQPEQHFLIVDSGQSQTSVWSSYYTGSLFANKAALHHTHVESDITNLKAYALQSFNIVAGTGLSGGGNLSGTSVMLTVVPSQISHTLLADVGNNSHATIDTHLSNANIHRSINDGSNSLTELWSGNYIGFRISGAQIGPTILHSQLTQDQPEQHFLMLDNVRANSSTWSSLQIGTYLDNKSNVGHTHVESDITNLKAYALQSVNLVAGTGLSGGGNLSNGTISFAIVPSQIDHTAISNIGTNSHASIDTHIGTSSIHRSINDVGTGLTDLWSASNIITHLNNYALHTVNLVAGTGLTGGGNLSNGTITFTVNDAQIDHTLLMNIGSNSHANIDTHINTASIHRSINDSGTGLTDLWSASNLTTKFSGKSNVGHTHVETDITNLKAYALQSVNLVAGTGLTGGGNLSNGTITFTVNDAQIDHTLLMNIGTNSHASIDTHIGTASIHRSINDSGTSVTDLWSASNIISHLGNYSLQTVNLVAGTGLTGGGHLSDGTITFTVNDAQIDHTLITNIGTNSHANIDTHIGTTTIHRSINDVGTSSTDLWSASNIITHLNNYALHTVNLVAGTGLTGGGNLSNGTITFTVNDAQIDHTLLMNIGSNSHANIDTHINTASIHRQINDSGTSATDLWSASNLTTKFSGKSNVGHTHVETDITNLKAYALQTVNLVAGTGLSGGGNLSNGTITFTVNDAQIDHTLIANIGTNSHANIDTHIGTSSIHRSINDVGIGLTDLWSASNLTTKFSDKSNVGHTHVETDITNLKAYALQSTTVSAGTGLTGGGNLSGNISFSIVPAQIDHTLIANIGTNSHANIDTHIGTASIHRSINDVGTSATDLWSASNIITHLNAKQNSLGYVAENIANKGIANGYAPLDINNKIPDIYLSTRSIINTFVCSSQTDQLALSAQEGDVCVRTDINQTFIHLSTSLGTMADWVELLFPTAVSSVAGRTGNVVLSSADVGLSNVENTALSTWTGTSNIVTVGTISTGTWLGTVIADNKISSTLTGKTYNSISLVANATGFSVSGGTVSKTLKVDNSIELVGTDGTVMTFPSTSASLARTDASQSFTGLQTFLTGITSTSGNNSFGTLSASGQITSTVSTGTAPFVVASSTNVANLNASLLNGNTFADPGAIGSSTASTGAFTTLTATSINGLSLITDAIGFAVSGGTSSKTLTVDNSLEFAGTDSTKMTFPSSSASIARTDASQSFNGLQTFSNGITSTGANNSFGTLSASGQITSTVSTGTAPLVVASSTVVTNFNANYLNGNTFANPGAIGSGTASTGAFTSLTATYINNVGITANATGFSVSGGTVSKTLKVDNSIELVGTDGTVMTFPSTSASIARTDAAQSFTGLQTFLTGITSTVSNNSFGTLSASGQITSTVSTGTAPFVVASSTVVTNFNANYLNGNTFANPGAIGSGTASTGAFTTLTATTVNGISLVANAVGFSASGGTTSKTLTVDNSLEFAGTDSTKMTFPSTSASIARTDAAQSFTGLQTFLTGITSTGANNSFGTVSASGQITSTVATGTTPFVVSSSTNVPNLNASYLNGNTFLAPGTIGSIVASPAYFTALTATSINNVGITANAVGFSVSGGTSSKTLTVDNSLEFAGTDSTKMTFPSTSASIARTDAAQSFTGLQTFLTGITSTSGNNSFGTLSASGQITSTVATGTAPFVVASSTMVANLNAATAGTATSLTGGNNTTLLGSIPYQSATNVTTLLAPNTSVTKSFLSETGTGTNGSAPVWTTVLKSDVGLSNVENTALSTWTGTSNIVTVGTISTGTWLGTVIADNKISSTLTGKTYNSISLVANATGFSVSGGTSSKTLTVDNSLEFAGTDSTKMTFPSTSASIARTDAAQSFTGLQTFLTDISVADQMISTVATGTAPLVVASSTNVANLNASLLNGNTFANPGAIGSGTSSTGAFTTLTATTVNGISLVANATGFSVSGGTSSKTLKVDNSIELVGTDGTVMTFPSSSASLARTDAAQSFTGLQTFLTGITSTGGNNSFGTVSASGQITSTVSTGTAPFVVASSTNVANLNASLLNGNTPNTPAWNAYWIQNTYVNPANIGNSKALVYNSTTGNLEYQAVLTALMSTLPYVQVRKTTTTSYTNAAYTTVTWDIVDSNNVIPTSLLLDVGTYEITYEVTNSQDTGALYQVVYNGSVLPGSTLLDNAYNMQNCITISFIASISVAGYAPLLQIKANTVTALQVTGAQMYIMRLSGVKGDTGAAGANGGTMAIQQGGSTVVAAANTMNFDATDFIVTSNGSTANVSATSAMSSIGYSVCLGTAAGTSFTSATATVATRVIWPGTTAGFTATTVAIAAYVSAASVVGTFTVYDVTNSQVICTLSVTNLTPFAVTAGTAANLSAGRSLWELRGSRNSGTFYVSNISIY